MSDASSGFKTGAEQELADKLRKKHHVNEGPEVGASDNPARNIPWFIVARLNVCPTRSRGSALACEAAAAGRVRSRTTDRRHEWQ